MSYHEGDKKIADNNTELLEYIKRLEKGQHE
jgi:hypothetical protein